MSVAWWWLGTYEDLLSTSAKMGSWTTTARDWMSPRPHLLAAHPEEAFTPPTLCSSSTWTTTTRQSERRWALSCSGASCWRSSHGCSNILSPCPPEPQAVPPWPPCWQSPLLWSLAGVFRGPGHPCWPSHWTLLTLHHLCPKSSCWLIAWKPLPSASYSRTKPRGCRASWSQQVPFKLVHFTLGSQSPAPE